MTEEFVDYQTAFDMKSLGFDEFCFAHYCNGDLITKTAILKSSTMQYYKQSNINPSNQYQNCTAPLYQQAFRWMYQKLGLEKASMPLDIESQQLMLKDLIQVLAKRSNKQT
jgi:hypothetical protein